MEPPRRVVEGPGSRQSGSKRLKIDVACDNCRAKKVKCDGVRPGKSSPDAAVLWNVQMELNGSYIMLIMYLLPAKID